MQKDWDILIVGGGAAGLMAACGTAGAGRSVAVLEKMPRPGRKIVITGKGRCNFTNVKPWEDFSSHIHGKSAFLKPAFYHLTPGDLRDFLDRAGMASVVERGDRAFPASLRSMDVVDALERAVREAGASLLTGRTVRDIAKEENGFLLTCADGSRLHCRRLILATGGLSYPSTGSTGDGYRWAEALGHTLRPRFPSLTALVPTGYKTGTKTGVIERSTPLSETGRLLCGTVLKNVGLSLYVEDRLVQEAFGELAFTDGGIEGPIGFQVSRNAVKALCAGQPARVGIDLKPAVETAQLAARIRQQGALSAGSPDRRGTAVPVGLLPARLMQGFLTCHPALRRPKTDPETWARQLKNWEFPLAGFVGYERAVVTAGGVPTDEVSPKTLESRIIPGLYFCGEILDLDGDTGGYNLHTAFSTGFLAGRRAAESLA